ncbi:hypothetical protein HDU96_009390 [Phlyctochytrium bullatum]|nr:hypothetical protein HDU96_009390 [Phlyctochytrium bullatum]
MQRVAPKQRNGLPAKCKGVASETFSLRVGVQSNTTPGLRPRLRLPDSEDIAARNVRTTNQGRRLRLSDDNDLNGGPKSSRRIRLPDLEEIKPESLNQKSARRLRLPEEVSNVSPAKAAAPVPSRKTSSGGNVGAEDEDSTMADDKDIDQLGDDYDGRRRQADRKRHGKDGRDGAKNARKGKEKGLSKFDKDEIKRKKLQKAASRPKPEDRDVYLPPGITVASLGALLKIPFDTYKEDQNPKIGPLIPQGHQSLLSWVT